MLKLVVLISGTGSNLKALIDACQDETYPASIVAVGADVDAPGLRHATSAGIPVFIVHPQDHESRDEWGRHLAQRIQEHGIGIGTTPGLIVSAGLMRILPESFVQTFSPHIINTHPALLPKYPGAHAVRDALADSATTTGVTVHVIDAGVDTGPVLRQASLTIYAHENEADLHNRIKELERPLLVDTVRDIALGRIDLTDPQLGSPAHPIRQEQPANGSAE